MALEFTEKLAQIFYRIIERNNRENEEILTDPTRSAPLNPDGTINHEAQKNIRRTLKNSADNALLIDVLSTMSSKWYENARNTIRER